MCGIAGIKYKKGAGPLGRDLLSILAGINHRGPDSAGLALYGAEAPAGSLKMRGRINVDPQEPLFKEVTGRLYQEITEAGGRPLETAWFGDAFRLVFTGNGNIKALAERLVRLEHVEVQSIGNIMEITKAVGLSQELDHQFGLAGFVGSHGIGHVRLATESRITVSYSHPFWAFGFNDVAVVHNGQLTNYYRLRRWLQNRGWTFTTENDTELIAIYIADKLEQGFTLRETLHQSQQDFDGTYSFIVSTADAIGYAKDMLGAKPLVVAETEDMILLASEEVGIQRVLRDPGLKTVEPYPSEVMTW